MTRTRRIFNLVSDYLTYPLSPVSFSRFKVSNLIKEHDLYSHVKSLVFFGSPSSILVVMLVALKQFQVPGGYMWNKHIQRTGLVYLDSPV